MLSVEVSQIDINESIKFTLIVYKLLANVKAFPALVLEKHPVQTNPLGKFATPVLLNLISAPILVQKRFAYTSQPEASVLTVVILMNLIIIIRGKCIITAYSTCPKSVAEHDKLTSFSTGRKRCTH